MGDTMILATDGRDNRGNRMRMNQQVGKNTEAFEYLGDINGRAAIHWCESEDAAQAAIRTLNRLFPANEYAIVQTKEVWAIPKTPAVRAVYTENGLLPA
jgi:hypothetical protein